MDTPRHDEFVKQVTQILGYPFNNCNSYISTQIIQPDISFNLFLSAGEYELVKHALSIAANVVDERRGGDAALKYDELWDRLQSWNHTDPE
tara:strand:+ start:18757 stop:19029 length:273 start_codon:yes stop_codon:yes gene_type:complete